jgi:hypothetical protein
MAGRQTRGIILQKKGINAQKHDGRRIDGRGRKARNMPECAMMHASRAAPKSPLRFQADAIVKQGRMTRI